MIPHYLIATATAVALVASSSPAAAQSLEQLRQRVLVLERKLEIQDEQADDKAKTAASTSVGEKGFSWKSGDGAYELKFRGLLQADSRFYLGDNKIFNDGFILRRFEPTFELTLAKFVFLRLQPQFAATNDSDGISKVGTSDVYGELRFDPALVVRAGKFKAPVDLENLQPTSAITFIERGLPTELGPGRELGIQVHGTLFDGNAQYALGIFNGTADGRDANFQDVDNRKEIAARLFFTPFGNDYGVLRGLGVGVGGSTGNATTAANNGTAAGLAALNGTLPRYRTPGQNVFFNYAVNGVTATTVQANGDRYRFAPQAYWYNGGFGLQTEYIESSEQVSLGGLNKFFTHRAWQVATSYLLTGEDAGYSGPPKPRTPFAVGGEGWGALEIAGRYGSLLTDGDAFTSGFASATASRRATTAGFALNWHLNSNVKIGTGYDWTRFSGGAARADERAAFSRLQISF